MDAHRWLITALQDWSGDAGMTNRFLSRRRRTQTDNELQRSRDGNANEGASLGDALLPTSWVVNNRKREAPSDEPRAEPDQIPPADEEWREDPASVC